MDHETNTATLNGSDSLSWRKPHRLAFYGVITVILVTAPHLMPDNYWLRIYTMTGLWIMLALGLNVVAGFAGLLDLAYVAFFGIGGYAFALLSSSQFDIHLPFLLVLPLTAVITMAVGFALGSTSLRLKGDYLAVVTLAFSQIFKLLLLNLDTPIDITGGVNGIYSFDPIDIFGFKIISPVAYAYLIWFAALIVTIGAFRMKASRIGRGWEALREDELAAEAMGVNTTWMKLLAFAGGAFVAGGTGALFASFQDSVFPNNFDFQQLVIVYCMVILGGLGNVTGVILGAVILLIPRLASWRVMLGSLLGMIAASLLFNLVENPQNPMWAIPWHWHLVLGGFAFGTIFMATDPVTSSQTDTGRWYYGILVGVLTVLIRTTNPLFPEGIMMAILFANVSAPLIDHFVIAANIRRRAHRRGR